jgi:signal transduction histidine kinase
VSLLIITEREEEFDLLKSQLFLKGEIIVGCLREEFRIAQLDHHRYWLVIVGGNISADLVAEIRGRGLPVIQWSGENRAGGSGSLNDGINYEQGGDRDRLNYLIQQGVLEQSLPYLTYLQQQLETSKTLEELGDLFCEGLAPILLNRPYLIRVLFNQKPLLFPRDQSLYPVFEELKCAGIDPMHNLRDELGQLEAKDADENLNRLGPSSLSDLSTLKVNEQNIDPQYIIPLTWRTQNYGKIILFPRAYPPHQLRAIINLVEVMTKMFANAIANLELEQKTENYRTEIEQQNEFLALTIHDIRNPLGSIILFAKMLKKQVYGGLNDKQDNYVNRIINVGEYLLQLINNLLDLSKANSSQATLNLETIAPHKLGAEIVDLFAEQARDRGLQLHLLSDPHCPYFQGDPTHIKQILINLLANAIKFTAQGSVILRLYTQSPWIYFAIEDTGIGIKPEDQQKLFHPFTQIRHNLDNTPKGTGLGLAVSLSLAKLHGGNITVRSQAGQGSTFILSLPENTP